jgi:hypothetical protein
MPPSVEQLSAGRDGLPTAGQLWQQPQRMKMTEWHVIRIICLRKGVSGNSWMIHFPRQQCRLEIEPSRRAAARFMAGMVVAVVGQLFRRLSMKQVVHHFRWPIRDREDHGYLLRWQRIGQLRSGVALARGSSENHPEYFWSIDQMDDFAYDSQQR